MRELARFYDAAEAEVAAGFLCSQGFEVELPERHTLGAQPEMRVAFGGYRLLVADRDHFLAQDALKRVRKRPEQIQMHLALPLAPTHIEDVTVPTGHTMRTG